MHSGERWRLGHRPGLDGLRGIAVLLVLLAHGDVPSTDSSGVVGVTMFFTLSGFLITTLLLEETDRTGGISFRRFYERRARRLLPALVVTVAAVSLIGLWRPGFAPVRQTLGTVFYVNNWVLADRVQQLQGLAHTWSLSIEEQFYIVVPVVVLLLRRRPTVLAALCGIGAFGALLLRAGLFQGDGTYGRMYYGTDARADALLIGVAFAAAMRLAPAQSGRSWVGGACWTVVVASCFAPKFSAISLVLMPFAVAVAMVPLIIAGLGPTRALAARWLVWVGRRSYGVYLYHFPVAVLLRQEGLPWGVRLPLVVVSGLALAALSWRYLEKPFLVSRAGSGDRVERGGRLPGGVLGSEPVG